MAVPRGEYQQGPGRVRRLNIYWSRSAARRAYSLMHLRHRLIEHFGRYLVGDDEDESAFHAFIIAKPEIAFLFPSEDDRRAAIGA